LRWPTALAVNPLDNSLHILDNGLVLKLTRDSHIITVAGRSPLCAAFVNSSATTSLDEDSSSAMDSVLEHVENLAFSPDGDLYLVESNGEEIRRLRLSVFVGFIFTSAKEVMFLPVLVCLSVCLSVCEQDNSKSYRRIFLKF